MAASTETILTPAGRARRYLDQCRLDRTIALTAGIGGGGRMLICPSCIADAIQDGMMVDHEPSDDELDRGVSEIADLDPQTCLAHGECCEICEREWTGLEWRSVEVA